MHITTAFVERLLDLPQSEQRHFFRKNIDDIDFHHLMAKTRDMWNEEGTTEAQRDKLSDLRDSCIAAVPPLYSEPFEPIVNNQGDVHVGVNLEQNED